MIIFPYKMTSKSAKSLAAALKCRRVHRVNSKFKNNYDHTVINWGCSSFVNDFPVNRWINNPRAVAVAGNKLSSFVTLQAVVPDNIPDFTTDREEAQEWVDGGKTVVARSILTGHSGKGISIHSKGEELPQALLYVQYIKKKKEYRAHVIDGRVVDVQEKRKRRSVDNDLVDYRVRNSHTGWVYCRDGVDYNDDLVDLAVDSVRALGLDFGGVDIIYNEHYDKHYVLEVNTAVGLEGETVDLYAKYLRRLANA